MTARLDLKFMKLAIEEARKSNSEDDRMHPRVGVVVVGANGDTLACAHRGEIGNGDHAEFTVLERKLQNMSVVGATVYTTLEPCTTRNHPKIACAHRLIDRKIKRVVIGMLDPNPNICGRGIWHLRESNVATDLFPHGLMCVVEELNRDFTRSHRSVVSLSATQGAGLALSGPAVQESASSPTLTGDLQHVIALLEAVDDQNWSAAEAALQAMPAMGVNEETARRLRITYLAARVEAGGGATFVDELRSMVPSSEGGSAAERLGDIFLKAQNLAEAISWFTVAAERKQSPRGRMEATLKLADCYGKSARQTRLSTF